MPNRRNNHLCYFRKYREQRGIESIENKHAEFRPSPSIKKITQAHSDSSPDLMESRSYLNKQDNFALCLSPNYAVVTYQTLAAVFHVRARSLRLAGFCDPHL